MRKEVWLLLAVVAVLLAALVIRKVSTPSAVSGSEVPKPVTAPIPIPAPKPQPAQVRSSPAAETSKPQPLVPEVAVEVAPAAQEQQPSGGGAPPVEAIFAGSDNQPRALVGDALVSEGNMVRGYRVRKVHADGVEFERDGQIWVQKLN